MVEVAMAMEEKFNTKIPDEQLSELRTVGDAVNYIKEHSAA
jgi:acyl carrier protein